MSLFEITYLTRKSFHRRGIHARGLLVHCVQATHECNGLSVPSGRSKVYFFIAVGVLAERGARPHRSARGAPRPSLGRRNLRSVGLDKTADRIFIICNLHGEVRLVKSLSQGLECVAHFTRVCTRMAGSVRNLHNSRFD